MLSTEQAQGGERVVFGELHRIREGRENRFRAAGPSRAAAQPPRPAKVAVLLALAHRVQREIDAGTMRDRAEAARKLGISRARVTQILDLISLSPRIQEVVLCAVTGDSAEPVTERSLREVLKYDSWALQEAVWVAPRRAA